jgi:hypothetical protein
MWFGVLSLSIFKGVFMAGIVGGIPDKLGNRYEAKWLVRNLLDVYQGNAEWIQFEGISPEFDGFEFAFCKDGIVQWHQTKNSNDNWAVKSLARQNVLSAFKKRLECSVSNTCYFISQDPAKNMRQLVKRATLADSLESFRRDALNKTLLTDFSDLCTAWETDDETAYLWLKRCNFVTQDDSEMSRYIESVGGLLFCNERHLIFPILREYCEQRFNRKLTTETIKAEIRENKVLHSKEWSHNPTLLERIGTETDAYLKTYIPFGAGGSTIPRHQSHQIADLVKDPDGAPVVLVKGIAGSGKSGVIRELIEHLRALNIPHLACRIDHNLKHDSPEAIGEKLTGRKESPVTTLRGIAQKGVSVLIIDQLDAVSEASGRDGAVKDAVLRMAEDIRLLKQVRLVLVCRTFDIASDHRLKELDQRDAVAKIEIPMLNWEKDVAPLLAKKGITNVFSNTQKRLLTLPLNLAVFLKSKGENTSFDSRNDLFDILTKMKERDLRRERSVSWSLIQPLTAMANAMSDGQELAVPAQTLDEFSGAVDLLASEGLIVCARNHINFFHESFFDYIYARSFVLGKQSVLDLLTSSAQYLFRRTQTRQIFEALRQGNNLRYLHELKSVLSSPSVRFHIKTAISQWLGSQEAPSESEFEIIDALDDSKAPFNPLVHQAVFNSIGWFDLLHLKGWIIFNLESQISERVDQVLWWLRRMADERPIVVIQVLQKWWNEDLVRGKQLISWFSYASLTKPDVMLSKFLIQLMKEYPSCLFEKNSLERVEGLAASWLDKRPEDSCEILKTLFGCWFISHPGQHPFEHGEFSEFEIHYLEDIANKNPSVFIEGTIDTLLRSIDLINKRSAHGERDYSFRRRVNSGHYFGADKFTDLFRTALQLIARKDHRRAKEILLKLNPSLHEVILHFHLETIRANPSMLHSLFYNLISLDNLLDAGWDGARWKSFADTAHQVFAYLSIEKKAEAEIAVINLRPMIDRAISWAHRTQKEDEPKYHCKDEALTCLRWSEVDHLYVFESIGEKLLTPIGWHELDMLRRKFPRESVPGPSEYGLRKTASPIKFKNTEFMTDAQWLRAIKRYCWHDTDSWSDSKYHGGVDLLAENLQTATERAPIRFASFMRKIPVTANCTYIKHILWGLSGLNDVGIHILAVALEYAHSFPGKPFEYEIIRIFEQHPEVALQPRLFEILKWNITHGVDCDDDRKTMPHEREEFSTIDELIDRVDQLIARSGNSIRGRALHALEKVLCKLPELAEQAWVIVENRIEEEGFLSVRCCIIAPLRSLYNIDKERCCKLVYNLITKGEMLARDESKFYPLASSIGTPLFQHIISSFPDTGRALIDNMLGAGEGYSRQIAAWHVFCLRFRNKDYQRLATKLAGEGVVYRRLAAGVAAGMLTIEANRDLATEDLIQFFNDEDTKVREQAARVFWEMKDTDVQRFNKVAEGYVNSRAIYDQSHYFFHSLKQSNGNVSEIIISAAEKLILFQREQTDRRPNRVSTYDLPNLLKYEYSLSETRPDIKKRLLDLIDQMLEQGLHGTEKIISAHDRL